MRRKVSKSPFFISIFNDGVLSDTIFFTLSNYIATAISFISSFIIRKVLGPLTMGLYTELMLVLQYSRFHNLGMMNALEREVPFYLGKKDLAKVEEVKKTVLVFLIFSACNIAAILCIVSFFVGLHKTGLRFIAALVFFETIISFYEALMQSYNRFRLWSIFAIVVGFLDTLLKIIFVIAWGLNGLLGAMVLVTILTIAIYYFWSRCDVDLHAKVRLKEVIRLLKLGIPLIIFRGMYLLSISIDKLAIIFFLGRLQLGYYSIATMVYNYLTLLPKYSYKTLYPKFIETFGKNEDIEEIKKYLIIPNRVFACFFSVLIGLSIIAIPFFVAYLLPKFKNGIFAAQIVACASFFSALIYTWHYLLIALYKQTKLVWLYGISVIIAVIFNVIFIEFLKMHITGVAIATLISQLAFTTLLICYCYRHYTKDIFEHIKLLFSSYLPSVLLIVSFLLTRLFYPRMVSFKSDMLEFVFSCGLFLLVSFPFMYSANKKDKLLHRLFSMVKARNA